MGEDRGLGGEEIRALDRAHVVHSWSVQSAIDPLPVVAAEGSWFVDADGQRYLDFASQVVNANLGHQHPRVTAAIAAQAGRLCALGPGFASEGRSRLGRLLAEVAPGDLTTSFFTNGGADAVENAVKLARWYTGRSKVIARYRSYHGATAGAASLTGDPRRWPAEPGVPGVVRLLDPYPYRCPAGHPYDGVPPSPGRPVAHADGSGHADSRHGHSRHGRCRGGRSRHVAPGADAAVARGRGLRRLPRLLRRPAPRGGPAVRRPRERGRRACSRPSPGATACWCRPTATCARSARCATGTASSSSSTRSWPGSAAPGAGSPASTGTSSPTS